MNKKPTNEEYSEFRSRTSKDFISAHKKVVNDFLGESLRVRDEIDALRIAIQFMENRVITLLSAEQEQGYLRSLDKQKEG